MEVLSSETKFAHLGKPGTAFSKGFQRRLDLVVSIVDLHNKVILDEGCGEGVWVEQFMKFTAPENVYGSDIDPESIRIALANNKLLITTNLKVSTVEDLQFGDSMFDIVFSNEVLEHVVDDRKAVTEVLRTLKQEGKFIVFTPNRGWPFETHGMFLKGKYYWGNIPLLPWMPKFMRKKFSPHVRNYSNGDIKKLFANLNCKIIYHKHVFPAFDKLERRFGILGKIFQSFFHALEKTPLHFFGISHFIVVEKI